MRLLYGVVGEGMGHAMRSQVVLESLFAQGHDVRIVASGRAASHLERLHPGRVLRITGLQLVYRDNMVSFVRTMLANLRSVASVPTNLRRYLETAHDFQPDVVISDFESWSYWFARGMQIPIISVDNMQIIDRCHHDPRLISDHRRAFRVARSVVRNKLPKCNAYLVTTFFDVPIAKPRTRLHPPILRRVILDAALRVRAGSHVVVYQTGTSHDALVRELKAVNAEFRVYGLRRDLTKDQVEDNLTFRPFSEERFIDDVATSRAVVAGGGFTLMTECIYLGKPMLSVPVVGQFEQILNAEYLQGLGYGRWAARVDAAGVRRFLDEAEACRERLREFRHDHNAGFFADLDQTLQAAEAEGALSP
jgi:uncharacterized protein (TIGR00661 family)